MPVYMLYGFRWPRAGFTGIRVYIVLNNLEDATAEYVQKPITNKLLLESFSKTEPDIASNLPELRFVEQYDPEDESHDAVSKPYAYVGAKVISIPEEGSQNAGSSWNADIFQENPLDPAGTKALAEFRDKYAAGERIGWWIVYNGDPERYFPQDEDDIMEEDEDYYDDDSYDRSVSSSGAPSTPTVSLFTRLSDLISYRGCGLTIAVSQLHSSGFPSLSRVSSANGPHDCCTRYIMSDEIFSKRGGGFISIGWLSVSVGVCSGYNGRACALFRVLSFSLLISFIFYFSGQNQLEPYFPFFQLASNVSPFTANCRM